MSNEIIREALLAALESTPMPDGIGIGGGCLEFQYPSWVQKVNEALALLDTQGWRTDMENAPRDGTDILVVAAVMHNGHLRWSQITKIYFELFEDRGWLCSQTHKPVIIPPKMWQPMPPLPAPPTPNEE